MAEEMDGAYAYDMRLVHIIFPCDFRIQGAARVS